MDSLALQMVKTEVNEDDPEIVLEKAVKDLSTPRATIH